MESLCSATPLPALLSLYLAFSFLLTTSIDARRAQ